MKRKRKKRKSNKVNCAQHFKDWGEIGRQVILNGKEVTVYTVKKLIKAFASAGIPRTYTTIYLWRVAGIMPRSPIVISDTEYYTKGMIECIVTTCLECGVGAKIPNKEYFKTRLNTAFQQEVERELRNE